MNAGRQKVERVLALSPIYNIGLNLKLSSKLIPVLKVKAWFGIFFPGSVPESAIFSEDFGSSCWKIEL